MNKKSQRSNQDTFVDFMTHPMVKGSILGAGVMFLVTPGINKVTYRSKNTHMPWSQAFSGWQPLVVSGVVGCATSFAVKSLLIDTEEKESSFRAFGTSATAGAVSGITLCPFESVNVNHQGRSGTVADTARSMLKHHGYAGFFRGTGGMMIRESAWTMMYMTAVPTISQNLQKRDYNRATADALALIVSACMFGFASAPINRLRIMKQADLTKPGTTPSYRQLATAMFQEHKISAKHAKVAGCFKGAGVRSITSAFAGGLFYYGSEGYDRVVSQHVCKP